LGAKQSAAQLILAKSLQPLWQHPQIYHKKTRLHQTFANGIATGGQYAIWCCSL